VAKLYLGPPPRYTFRALPDEVIAANSSAR
jgi:hypothetical protein